MLGFWIIVSHLVGAYLTTSEYVQNRAVASTTFAVIAAVLYMIPFVLFLPSTPLSIIAVLIFRFIVVRFSIPDYLIWARNLMAPADQRVQRVVKEGKVEMERGSTNQIVSIHGGSIALHCVFNALAIIVL